MAFASFSCKRTAWASVHRILIHWKPIETYSLRSSQKSVPFRAFTTWVLSNGCVDGQSNDMKPMWALGIMHLSILLQGGEVELFNSLGSADGYRIIGYLVQWEFLYMLSSKRLESFDIACIASGVFDVPLVPHLDALKHIIFSQAAAMESLLQIRPMVENGKGERTQTPSG